MTSEFLNRITVIGAGTLAVIVFGGLCVRHNVPAIEADLTGRALEALRKARIGWATVTADGRDLILSGVAPDENAQAVALDAAAVRGVRRVENDLETVVDYVMDDAGTATEPATVTSTGPALAPPSPPERYRTRIIVADERLVLEGAVPDERQRRELVERAQSQFGVVTVEARLQAAPDAPDGWLAAAALALEIADLLVFGEIDIVDRSVHVTGLTATRDGDARIRELVATALPDGYTGTAETGARAELEAALRTAPGLAERLSQRSRTTQRPATAPATIDAAECEARFRRVIGDRRILFATASDELTRDSFDLVTELAAVLKRCPATRVAIEGHTDDQGLREDNLALSQRRAEAVMQVLVARGIGLGRLSARGFGEERPLVANETAADRAMNRRIEFVFERR